MKMSILSCLATLFVATVGQVSISVAQESLPTDLKINCKMESVRTGHGGRSESKEIVMIDLGKVQSGYETTGLVVQSTNTFGETSENQYRIASIKSLGGGLFFVSGKSVGVGSYSFFLQNSAQSYTFIKTYSNPYWGDELFTTQCVQN
jgi:hypothetical protein